MLPNFLDKGRGGGAKQERPVTLQGFLGGAGPEEEAPNSLGQRRGEARSARFSGSLEQDEVWEGCPRPVTS